MTYPSPLLEAGAWLRVLAPFLLVCLLPGALIFARPLLRADRVAGLALALATGIALHVLLFEFASQLGWRAGGWDFALACIAVAACAALWRPLQRRVTAALPSKAQDPGPSRWVGLAVAATLGQLLIGIGSSAVPVGDGANHVYLVERIVRHGSLLQQSLQPELPAHLPFVYYAGWHGLAASLTRLGGAAPYVTTWLLVLVVTALLPLSFYGLWRFCGFSARVATVAAFLPLLNSYMPTGLLAWGGFGHLVAWAMLPLSIWSLRALLQVPDRSAGMLWGSVFGLSLLALLRVHASELALVALLGVPLIANAHRDGIRWNSAGLGLALALVILGAAATLALRQVPFDYADADRLHAAAAFSDLGRALDKLNRALGPWAPLRLLAIAGLWIALRRSATRAFALAASLAGLLFLTLSAFRDPLSLALSRAFYQEPTRVFYLQLVFAPPMAALALLQAHRWLITHVASARARALWLTLAVALLLPGALGPVRNLRRDVRARVFDAECYELALRMRSQIAEDFWIANGTLDGSQWAMQVSGLQFLQPCNWGLVREEGGGFAKAVQGLRTHPWPEQTLALRELGVELVYASDRVERWARGKPLLRSDLEDDPRFEAILESEHAAVYRIHWAAEEGSGGGPSGM